MRFEQTKDILEHAKSFHKYIAEYYHQLKEKSNKERLKMFLDYFEEHQKYLEETITAYSESLSEKLLKTWFQTSPCEEVFKKLQALLKAGEDSIDELIQLALEVDDCMINMYKTLAEGAEIKNVREIFNNLIQLVENEKRKTVRTLILSADM